MHGIDARIEERYVVSHDGTRICYYVCGEGPRTWLIPPGLGTPFISWKHIVERFQDRLTMIVVDPRGFYGSGVPTDPEAVTVEDQARDIANIIAAENLDDFYLGGWSLSVQISLEHYQRQPKGIRGLLLINGAYEHILSTAFEIPMGEAILPRVVGGATRLGPLLSPTMKTLMSTVATPRAMAALGLVSDNVEFFAKLFDELKHIDWVCYLRTMLRANEHSAAAYLRLVDVPTLITAGGRDRMTPVATAELMHAQIRDSQLAVLPKGTHYTIAEYPHELNDVLQGFFHRVDPELFPVHSV